MRPGFKSQERHNFFFFYVFFLSLFLQCKFANSTLLSLLSFSYFITPYDAQASSAFSALICLCSLVHEIRAFYAPVMFVHVVKDFYPRMFQ